MFPHRPFRSPTAGAALLRSSRPLPHPGRHRFGLCVARLKDRTLLSGPSGDVLAAVAPKIELGTSKTGTLAPAVGDRKSRWGDMASSPRRGS